jgi:hypothetical protein
MDTKLRVLDFLGLLHAQVIVQPPVSQKIQMAKCGMATPTPKEGN